MEKISGIIPSSARVAAVDLKESPVRPGTPAFGRPQAASGAASVPTNAGGAMEKAADMFSKQTDWRSKDNSRAALVSEVSNAFFMKRTEPPAGASAAAGQVAASSNEAPLQQPEGLYPRGSFIDRVA